MSLDLTGVERENMNGSEPAWFDHLASSRIALRYRLAPSV